MAELQEIEVKILPDGHVQLEVRGVKGPRCRELTAGLERVLGGHVVSRQHTADFGDAAVESDEAPRRLEQQDRTRP
jgi:hypothetical protein